MKKLIAFFVIAILLISIRYFKTDDFSPFRDFSHVVIVSAKPYNDLTVQVQNGEQYYYDFENTEENRVILENIDKNDVEGYVFYYQLDKKLKDFTSHFDYIYQGEAVGSYDVYYGYYAGYNDFRYVSGKKVNFHLVKTDSSWILGLPLIVTGY